MKVEASTSLLPQMAKSYREFGYKRQAEGDEAAAGAGLTAADALEEVAELRKHTEALVRRTERMKAAIAAIWQASRGPLTEDTMQRIRDLADFKE